VIPDVRQCTRPGERGRGEMTEETDSYRAVYHNSTSKPSIG
jgi:hypothetical protein